MANGKLAMISAKTAIAKFQTKFKPAGDGWVVDGLDWIGEALAMMNLTQGAVPSAIDVDVVDYKALIPICPDALISVTYESCNLPIDRPSNFGDTSHMKQRARAWISGPYLKTNFETGTVTFHVYSTPLGDDGYPLMPNSAMALEAISWYMLREYLSQGNTHPTFSYKDANTQWETWWPRGANDVNFPTPYNQDAFRQMWVNIIPQVNLHHTGGRVPDYTASYPHGDISEFTGTAIS